MSNTAILDRTAAPAPARHLRAVTGPVPTVAPEPRDEQGSSAQRNLPPGTAPAASPSTSASTRSRPPRPASRSACSSTHCGARIAEIAPNAETYATVALAPVGSGGRDVDVVRLALHEPSAIARTKQEDVQEEDRAAGGVVVDISRKRVLIDGESAAFTFKEFELLQYLVLREGRTIERTELVVVALAGHDRRRGSRRAHHRRARPAPARQARPLRGHRPHGARHRLPVRPPRRRRHPLRPRHAFARPLLTGRASGRLSSCRVGGTLERRVAGSSRARLPDVGTLRVG